LQSGDVLKVDIGVHVKGRILDSAFTLAFDHTYDKLVEAVKAATNTGIRVGDILVWFVQVDHALTFCFGL
jgi:methionyl aminopeptidase